MAGRGTTVIPQSTRLVPAEGGYRHDGFATVLPSAMRREPEGSNPVAFDAALERGRRALAGVGTFESAELLREERDERDRIVSDAGVALKWFHAAGEEEVEEPRTLLAG